MRGKNSLYNFLAFLIGITITAIIQNIHVIYKPDNRTVNNDNRKNRGFYTSGWCSGESVDTRMCHFNNLCYHAEEERFVLIMSKKSTFIGFNSDHHRYLLDITGVPALNVKPFAFDVVIAEEFWNKSHPPIDMIEGQSFIMERYLAENMYHVLHDDILPLYWTYHDLCSGDVTACARTLNLILMDASFATEMYTLYRIFSKKKLGLKLMYHTDRITCFKEAYVGLRKYSVWYDYTHGGAEGPVPTSMSGPEVQQAASWMEERLCLWANGNAIDNLCTTNPETKKGECSMENSGHIVLLSRQFSRKILNEKAVIRKLQKISLRHFTNTSAPVKVVAMETHPVWELICIVRTAKVVVGMHGALQTVASIFLKPGTGVVELFPYAINPENVTPFKTAAEFPARHIVYRSWRNIDRNNTVGHPERQKDYGGIAHLPEEEQKAIQNITEVPTVDCCINPAFRYWLFQDTKVHLKSLEKTVVEVIHEIKYLGPAPKPLPVALIPAILEELTCTRQDKQIIVTFKKPWNLNYIQEHMKDKHHMYWVGLVQTEEDQLFAVNGTDTLYRFLDNRPDQSISVYAGHYVNHVITGRVARTTCDPLSEEEAKRIYSSLSEEEIQDFPIYVH